MAAPAALPNFQITARSYADLSRELSRCGNLPVLQDNTLVVQELRLIRNQLAGVQEETKQTGIQLAGVQKETKQTRIQLTGVEEEIRQTKNLVVAK